jgi:hypothetical protein
MGEFQLWPKVLDQSSPKVVNPAPGTLNDEVTILKIPVAEPGRGDN